MSLRLLLPTTSLFPFVRGVVLALGLLSLPTVGAHAQENAWKLLDFGLESGFRDAYEWPTAGSTLYFVDSLRGFYYPENELTVGARSYYATTDGGRTWTVMPEFVPVPQRMLDATFGISSSGWLTQNGGTSWQRIRPTLDATFNYFGTSAIAASPRHIIALSAPFEPDATTGQLREIGPKRLTTTTNGGATWVSIDSMVVETIAGTGERKLELYDSTGFGDLPAPAEMTDTFSVGWWQLYDMPDTLSAFVGSVAFGRVSGQLQNHYYIGRLNLRTMNATWTKLPFVDVIPTTAIRPPGIVFITPSIGYAIQTTTTSNVASYTIWRTTNAGTSWTSNAVPAWLDFASLRFINPMLGVAMNGISTDGGATWKQWAHPFEGGVFYAPDSTHYFVANRWSLFARSSDAGRTWQRNESGAVPRAVVANGGRVLVGRNYRSILTSSDYGLTWSDAGVDGTVPEAMSTVWALGMPDSIGAPQRVLGVATLITYDADTSLVVIESTDGGMSWSVSSALPGIKSPGGSVLMEFSQEVESNNTGYIATGRRLFASTDRGATWTLRDTSLFYQALESSTADQVVQINATGIHNSTNAGVAWVRTQTLPAARNRALGLQAFSPTEYRVLLPDRTRRNVDWNVGRSTDGGQTWTIEERAGAPRPLDGYAFWRDVDTVYAIGRGATVQRSTTGGNSFVLLKDSSIEFSALGAWIAAGTDSRNIYVAGAGDAIGRYEFAAPPPLAVPGEAVHNVSARLVTNEVSGRVVVEISLARSAHVTIDIVDIVGRSVVTDGSVLDAGMHRVGIDVGDVASGGYFLRIADGTHVTVLPLRVTH
jgi:hypothetical protein